MKRLNKRERKNEELGRSGTENQTLFFVFYVLILWFV